jgi:CelD/BcsL family acetyltransferase involved in cellulose biosynthesis
MKMSGRHKLPKTIVQNPSQMSETDWTTWATIQSRSPELQSPYFHPDYTKLLSELRPDVRIVCQYDETGKPIAFLPIQGKRFARPVGAPMSDYHAIITDQEDVTYDSLLSASGIGAYHFSCATDVTRLRLPQILARNETAAIDIKTTAEDWRAARDGSYRRHLKSNRRRSRKAEESIGPKRVELFSRDIDVYAALLTWKRKKFAQTGKYDVLSAEWTQSLIRRLWEQGPKAGLRCDMHALYFGDRLAAIDLGLSDGKTFHSWMVAYDDELSEYAPGIQLLESLIDATPETGYRHIDMGEGIDGYKRHYASASRPVVSGLVPLSGAAGRLSRIYAAAERWGVGPLKDAPGKLRRRYTQIAACEDGTGGRVRHMIAAFASTSRS